MHRYSVAICALWSIFTPCVCIYILFRSIIQEVANLEAQRRAFTSRVPRVKAESEAFRDDQSRAEAGAIESRGAGKEGAPVGDAEESMSSLPMVFVDEDQDPDDGVNIFDVEANVAAARAANAAAAAAAVASGDSASSAAEPSPVDNLSGESLQPEEPERDTSQDESYASFPPHLSFPGARETREAASHPQQPRTLQSGRARDDLSLRPLAPSSAKSGAERGAVVAREAMVSSNGGRRPPSRELRASGDRGVRPPSEVSEERRPPAGGEGDGASRRERARAAAVAAAQQDASTWGGILGVPLSSPLGAGAAGSSSRRAGEDAERMAREAEELAEMLEEDDAFEAGWTA